jgi:hypothetical protein
MVLVGLAFLLTGGPPRALRQVRSAQGLPRRPICWGLFLGATIR